MRRTALALIALRLRRRPRGLRRRGGGVAGAGDDDRGRSRRRYRDHGRDDHGRGDRGRRPVAGKEVFLGTSGCGSCHTFADAGTSGTIGPEPRRLVAQLRARRGPRDERFRRHALLLEHALRSRTSRTSRRTCRRRPAARPRRPLLDSLRDRSQGGPRRSRGVSRRARAQGRGGGVRRAARRGRALALARPAGRRAPLADEAEGEAIAEEPPRSSR